MTELTAPHPEATADLALQARRTALLAEVTPWLEDCAPTAREVRRKIEDLLGRGIDFVSESPKATDVRGLVE